MKTKTYYYCEKDCYGQRTGIIGEILLTQDEYKLYKQQGEYFLYEHYEDALFVALS